MGVPLLLLLPSCHGEELTNLPHRTVIVYMVADNNLDHFAVKDILQMERGWKEHFDGHLIVYVDRAEGAIPSHPVVLRIQHDTTASIASPVIGVYPEQNSCSGATLRAVLEEIIGRYPAKSYGLILWSHGTGWLPEGYRLQSGDIPREEKLGLPVFKSFGRDGGQEMCITLIPNSMPLRFDFILFDACFMGSVEVAYELKDCADYLIFSPTEILSHGYPYDTIVPLLFEPQINLRSIAKSFFHFYNSKEGFQRSATVSLVSTECLVELRVAFHQIIANNTTPIALNGIQQLETTRSNLFFDLGDYTQRIAGDGDYRKFESVLNRTVLLGLSTDQIFGQLDIDRFSGLSVFIPNKQHENLYPFYQTLRWHDENFSELNYDFDPFMLQQ